MHYRLNPYLCMCRMHVSYFFAHLPLWQLSFVLVSFLQISSCAPSFCSRLFGVIPPPHHYDQYTDTHELCDNLVAAQHPYSQEHIWDMEHGMVMFVKVVHDLYRHSHLLPHLETLRGAWCCWKYALEPTGFDPLVGSDGFDPLWCKSPNGPQVL
jgi:hypothetical protein